MSIRVCATVAFAEDAPEAVRLQACAALGASAERVAEIERAHAGLHLPGSLGGGDLTWDLGVADAEVLRSIRSRLGSAGGTGLVTDAAAGDRAIPAAVAGVEAWVLEPIASAVPRPDVAGIKRTNFVRVRDGAAHEAVEQWSREVPLLAHHVPAIRNWSLARVRPLFEADAAAVRGWTHVWEQDFETLDGLLVDYMASPYHWGFLDGWYDVEVHKCIIEPELAHLYCPSSESVLAWTAAATS